MNHIALIETGTRIPFIFLKDILSKPLTNHKLPHDFGGIFFELNLRKFKWLPFVSYYPLSQSDEYFFNHVKNGPDIYSKVYDKYMLVGGFNVEVSEPSLLQFFFSKYC